MVDNEEKYIYTENSELSNEFSHAEKENDTSIESQELILDLDKKLQTADKILEQTIEENIEGITRREFIKLSLHLLVPLFMGHSIGTLLKEPIARVKAYQDAIDELEDIPTPEAEKIHNIDVYGAGEEKITSAKQILKLYQTLDKNFENKNGIWVSEMQEVKIKQRKELLDPNERYLEVVIRQSGYNSFLERKESTGVDFVEWIQMHADAMNRCAEIAKPSCDLRTVLRRIIVIDDNMPNDFWDEQAFREQRGPALDIAYRNNFIEKLPLDTDASWAIADDYRKNIKEHSKQGYFWTLYVKEDGSGAAFRYPPEGMRAEKTHSLGFKNDSLSEKEGIWIDFGLTHEWLHYLWNLPDEYVQDVKDERQRFHNFSFATGSFAEPYFSPYLSYLGRKNIEQRRRWPFGEGGHIYDEHPKNITIKGMDSNEAVVGYEMRTARAEDGGYSRKIIPEEPNLKGDSDSVSFGDNMFEYGNNYTWLMNFTLSSGEKRDIYIPGAIFRMSIINGKFESAEYNIEFSGYTDSNKKTQIFELVDESDLESYFLKKTREEDNWYAKMKIDGTNTWGVWSLRD